MTRPTVDGFWFGNAHKMGSANDPYAHSGRVYLQKYSTIGDPFGRPYGGRFFWLAYPKVGGVCFRCALKWVKHFLDTPKSRSCIFDTPYNGRFFCLPVGGVFISYASQWAVTFIDTSTSRRHLFLTRPPVGGYYF